MTKIEQIVKVCETCDIVRLHEILETVCGMNIEPKECAVDRPTYTDMIEGTLLAESDDMISQLYNALHELNEF